MYHKHYTKISRQHEMQLKTSIKAILLPALCLIISILTANAQSFEWVKGMGGSYADYSRGVAVDKDGNVYVTGYFQSDTADFNRGGSGGILYKMGTRATDDVFLSKYDATGKFLWAKRMGGTGYDKSMGIALDAHSNVYITGYFSGIPDFNPGGNGGMLTNAGGYDGFLAKYDKDGNYQWGKSMGGSDFDYAFGVTVDNSDNVYVTGYIGILNSGSADFNPGGTGGIVNNAGGSDAFVAKYDKDGNYQWAKSMGGSDNDYSYSVAADDNNNVYVTGAMYSTTANFNSGNTGGILNNIGGSDVFLAKYDKDGNYQWAKNMGGNDNEVGYSVAVDAANKVYITGTVGSATADFNPGGIGGTLTVSGMTFIAKYDNEGNYLWAKSMGNKSSSPMGIALDGANNVYITGNFRDTADFNPGGSGGKLTTVGTQDIFSAKYSVDGNFFWVKGMGGRNSDMGYSVAVDINGNVLVGGSYSMYDKANNTADFNPGGSGGVLTCEGVTNACVVKFACTDTSSSYQEVSLTCGKSYTLKDSMYNNSGTYTAVFPNISGCDSTVTLNLTIIPIAQPVINIDDNYILRVTDPYFAYQWLKDGQPVQGAIDSIYMIKENGNYQVLVTNEYGCTDTSEIYQVTNYTGINDINTIIQQTKVYPNPAKDFVRIQSPISVNAIFTDITGRVIQEQKDAHIVPLRNVADGVYLLQIRDQNGVLIKTEKIVKHI